MNVRKRVLIAMSGMLLLLLVGLWLVRVVRLNREFHQSKSDVVMGEVIESNGITYQVTDAVIYDYAALVQEWEDYSWLGATGQYYLNEIHDGNDRKVLVYTVHMRLGNGKEGEPVPLPLDIQTRSGLFTNTYEMWMYDYLNPGLMLYPNTEIDVRVPIALPQTAFTEEEWNQLSEEDPNLDVVISFQPEIVKIHLNEVVHVTADEEAQEKLEELMEVAQELKAAREASRQLVQETNLYENNEGDCNGFHYSLGEVSVVTLEEVQAVSERAKLEAYTNPSDGSANYFFRTPVTITNTTDLAMQIYITSTWLAFVENENVRYEFEAFYWDFRQMNDPHDASLFILKPGESVEFDCIYCMLSLQGLEEELEALDCYFVINPNGGEFHRLDDAGVVFIRYEDGLRKE